MTKQKSREVPAAQLAMRDAIDRALKAKLTATQLRVLLALIHLVNLFDRLEDTVANRQIVDATGIHPRHIRRALGALHKAKVIHRTPGHGHTASLIKFGERAKQAHAEGAATAPGEGADSSVERGQIQSGGGGAHAPASEDLSEDLSEEVTPDSCDRGTESDPYELAASLITKLPSELKPDELRQKIGELSLSASQVIAALQVVAAEGRRFTYPRQLAEAITAEAARHEARRAERVAAGALADTDDLLDESRNTPSDPQAQAEGLHQLAAQLGRRSA